MRTNALSLRFASILLAASGLAPGETYFGTVEVVQHDAANNVSVSVGPGGTPGTLLTGGNRGDYVVNVPAADDLAEGVMVTSVAQNGRDNSASGDPPGTFYATSAVAPELLPTEYYISVFDAPSGAEFNINTAFGWFSYDEWLGGVARNTVNDGPIISLIASPGIALGAELVDNGGGVYTLDLTGLGAGSAEGVLLVSGARNEDNYALSLAKPDGTFDIICHDNGADAVLYESDPVSFVYLPVAQAGAGTLVACGRVNGDASTDVAGGSFAVTKGGVGEWLLSIDGHTPDSGTLLISPEGGSGINVDNVWSYEWDDANARWVIQGRDLPGTSMQDAQLPGEDMFSFAFLASPEVTPRMVTTAADEDDGSVLPSIGTGTSLREALKYSGFGATVRFAPELDGQTITLNLGEIRIYKPLTIDASHLSKGITISGNNTSRIFVIDPGIPVVMDSLNLTAGHADGGVDVGGAILVNAGELTLRNSTVFDNRAQGGGGGIAYLSSDQIIDSGRVTISNSTLTGNSAGAPGGAEAFGGAIFGAGEPFGGLTLNHVTVAANAAAGGGGVYLEGPATLGNSIIAGNTAHTPIVCDETLEPRICGHDIFVPLGPVMQPPVATGANLLGDLGDSRLTEGPGVLVDDPLLAPLGDYGGPTRTMHPQSDSPAIDAAIVSGTTPTTDQRGEARDDGLPDIGAVEVQGPLVTTTEDAELRRVILFAKPDDTITFDPALDGQTITLTSGQILIDKSLTIDASSLPAGIVISGNSSSRVFEITPTATVTLNSLELASGHASSAVGGAILNSGELTAMNCLFTGNVARGGAGQTPGSGSNGGGGGGGAGMGGAIFSDGPGLTLTDCVFSDNSAIGGNGGNGLNNSLNANPGGNGGGPNAGPGGAAGTAGGYG
ncbi:MAG: hypothetical protein K9M97_04195, partial [Akkermansiaceae bacterium]|nr:hypothetical protein [Akkermansiaceae bacterium]